MLISLNNITNVDQIKNDYLQTFFEAQEKFIMLRNPTVAESLERLVNTVLMTGIGICDVVYKSYNASYTSLQIDRMTF